jgi:hypothetical protein
MDHRYNWGQHLEYVQNAIFAEDDCAVRRTRLEHRTFQALFAFLESF